MVNVRYLLVIILVIVGLNGLAGGYYGLSGAEGVPTEWLAGNPFQTYFIPSLILIIAVAVPCLLAAYIVLTKRKSYPLYAFAAGILLLVWIIIQISIIGFVSWLQPAMFIAALLIVALSRSVSKNEERFSPQ